MNTKYDKGQLKYWVLTETLAEKLKVKILKILSAHNKEIDYSSLNSVKTYVMYIEDGIVELEFEFQCTDGTMIQLPCNFSLAECLDKNEIGGHELDDEIDIEELIAKDISDIFVA